MAQLERKIIYSLKVMEKLVARGYLPTATLPNPSRPEYICWVFDVTPEFQKDVDEILGGVHHD